MANRTRDYIRRQRWAHISRKKRIIHSQNDYWNFRHDGELSKGKIHCSCWMCRRKSYISAKMSDARNAARDIDMMEDFGVGRQTAEHLIHRTKTDNRRTLKGRARYI